MFFGVSILRRLPQTIPFRFLSCVAWVFATALTAHAALGGDITSVQADQVHMRGSVRVSSASGYVVQEIQGSNGIVVREYLSNAGKVFGVAWQGPLPPDLRQLLGSYFDRYVQGAQAQSVSRNRRGPVAVELPDLVVEASGHMRAFAGRAYAPDLIPANVRAEVVR